MSVSATFTNEGQRTTFFAGGGITNLEAQAFVEIDEYRRDDDDELSIEGDSADGSFDLHVRAARVSHHPEVEAILVRKVVTVAVTFQQRVLPVTEHRIDPMLYYLDAELLPASTALERDPGAIEAQPSLTTELEETRASWVVRTRHGRYRVLGDEPVAITTLDVTDNGRVKPARELICFECSKVMRYVSRSLNCSSCGYTKSV